MKIITHIRYFLPLVLLLVLVLFIIWQPHDPYAVSTEKSLQAPSINNWFGTDRLGRDLYSRTGLALRRSIILAGSAEIASFITAFCLAVIFSIMLRRHANTAAFIRLIIRLLPPLLFLFAIAAWARQNTLGPFLGLTALSFCFAWPIFNAEIEQSLNQSCVEGATALGATPSYILRRIVAPHSLPRLLKYAKLDFASLIAFEAFLGMSGLNHPPHPALGSLIFDSRYSILSGQSWLFIYPSLILAFTLFLLTIIKIFPLKGNFKRR